MMKKLNPNILLFSYAITLLIAAGIIMLFTTSILMKIIANILVIVAIMRFEQYRKDNVFFKGYELPHLIGALLL
jgi:hypothetical protein